MSSHSPGLRNIAILFLLRTRHSSRYEDYAAVGRGKKEEEKILMMRPVLKYDACTMGYR